MNIEAKDLIGKGFFPGETLALFADGAHLAQITRQLSYEIDFGRFRELFADYSDLLCAYYYIATDPSGEDPANRLLDWLDLNGWRTETKALRRFLDRGNEVVRGSFEVEITADMMRMSQFADHLILVSGNGDFSYLIHQLQDRGKRVTVVSSQKTPQLAVSKDLLRACDVFIDLADLKPFVTRSR